MSSESNTFNQNNNTDKNLSEKLITSFQIKDKGSCERRYWHLRLENPNQVIVGQLNINSIRNKFDILTSTISDKIDVLPCQKQR